MATQRLKLGGLVLLRLFSFESRKKRKTRFHRSAAEVAGSFGESLSL